MTQQLVIDSARTFLGTPWQHQARCKGVAVDCIGLLVGAFTEAGYKIEDVTDYGRNPNPRRFLGHLARYFDRMGGKADATLVEHDRDAWEFAQPGDVLAFSFVGLDTPQHVGICTGRHVIHTFQTAGKVAEHDMNLEWQRQLHSVWRLREWRL